MADIFFKCQTCGNNLVADDSAAGMTTHCPKCKAGTAVPKLVIVHFCPHCHEVLKFTGDMKGELVDCPSCKKELELPQQSGGEQKPLHPFICPKCNAELETFSAVAEQLVVCPNCNEKVRLRPKIRVRTGADTLAASEEMPAESEAPHVAAAKPAKQSRFPTLLRYGVIDLLLLVLFLIPLKELNGHNFLYILVQAASRQPAHSQAWNDGYGVGQSYGKLDKDAATDAHKNPAPADRVKIAPERAEGSPEYNDFWDGYAQGYAESR